MYPQSKQFITHFNYIRCLNNLMAEARLTYNRKLGKGLIPYVGEKDNLIKLTIRSLEDEFKIVQIDKEYSYASTSWLPVKAHYLIFNQLLTIEYIIKLQKNVFSNAHSSCINEFTRKLKTKEVQFSNPILNQVFDQSILKYKNRIGANLSAVVSKDTLYRIAIRKIAMYKVEDWKKKEKIDLRKPGHRQRLAAYLQGFSVSIFDFLYFMRLRSNYRDFAFIENVTADDTAEYFHCFYSFTVHLYNALAKLRHTMTIVRN